MAENTPNTDSAPKLGDLVFIQPPVGRVVKIAQEQTFGENGAIVEKIVATVEFTQNGQKATKTAELAILRKVARKVETPTETDKPAETVKPGQAKK